MVDSLVRTGATGERVLTNPAVFGSAPPSPEGLASAVRQALDTPTEVLQDGRNLTVRARLTVPDGSAQDVVIKRFGRQSLLKDAVDRHFGSKAARAFRAALYLANRGLGTPLPMAAVERWERTRLQEAYLVTRPVEGLQSFRDALIALYRRNGPCEALMALLERVAVFTAELHDAGLMHRDLGNQNLMLCESPDTPCGLCVLDLNRARCRGRPLTARERARDLSRIHLPSDFLRVFKEMYWRGEVPEAAFQRRERWERRAYALHCATRALRHPRRERTPPDATDDYPSDRDLWIWDERSVQAIAPFRSRDRHRLRSRGRVGATLRTLVQQALPAAREYRIQRDRAFSQPVESVGHRATVALTARPETLDRELDLLADLGARAVLVRLYHHEPPAAREATLAAVRRLHDAGYGVALALVQDRRAVRDPASWKAMGDAALRAVGEVVRWVEVGHAVNRVKWGLWGYDEFAQLMAPLEAWRRNHPHVRLTGPGGIDFEFDFLATALRVLPPGARFNSLSHHLYVDRRGAPESRQGRFDAVGKLALARAVARTSGRVDDGLIVSEFNWPLRGTGAWSPVGSPYVSPGPRHNDPSVDELDAARFTLRYLLLGLCSGLAEEMVYWRLVARGFGLVDDSDPSAWRRRPAFTALQTGYAQLSGARFEAAETRSAEGCRLRFRNARGRRLWVQWCSTPPAGATTTLEPPSLRQATSFTTAWGGRADATQALSAMRDGTPVFWEEPRPCDTPQTSMATPTSIAIANHGC